MSVLESGPVPLEVLRFLWLFVKIRSGDVCRCWRKCAFLG